MKRKKIYRTVSMLLIVLIAFTTFRTDHVYANFEGWIQRCLDYEENNSDEDDKDVGANTASGQAGSWTEEGTEANDIARKMWDYWKNKGFGGPAISGVMGNVAHEGGFDIPDRAEGHYGNSSETDGIAFGNIPATLSGYPVGDSGKPEGGAGHYQFTPFSKFAPVGDDKWLSTESQSDYVWSSEVGNASWLNDYIELSSVEQAVDDWFTLYERGRSLNPEKIESGKKAYQAFGGSNVEADSALANAVDTANQGEESEKEKKGVSDGCGNAKGDSSGGGSDSGANEIVEIAEGLLGFFTYGLIHGEKHIGSIENPDRNGITDCSGFVWLVFGQAGYKIPENMGWFTGTMEDDATGKQEYLEEISADEAGAGDVVIVTSNGKIGHTAILLEDWQDAPDAENSTEIIQMGGISMDGVNSDAFNSSFKSLVNSNHTITFARGIDK